jgi:hypothetical protein
MIFMKKLIAIAVVFVLAVGVAFAAEVGVDMFGGATIIKGDSGDGSPVEASGQFGLVRISASGQNDDGNFGGWLRMNSSWDGNVSGWGIVWWKPLDILEVKFGGNPDGQLDGVDGVTRWAYYQVANDVIADEHWRFNHSFYGGWGLNGTIVTLTPIEPLKISVAIPFASFAGDAKDLYSRLDAQVVYSLGIGKVAVSYRGSLNKSDTWSQWGNNGNNSTLYGYFGLSAIENLDIDLGIGYTIPVELEKEADEKTAKTYASPVGVGLGVKFSAGALGIKARVQGEFGGKLSGGNLKASVEDPTIFTADLMPFFAVTDKVSAHLSTGLIMTKPSEGESEVAWHIMPYVTVKANWWAPNFYAGIKFNSDGGKDAPVKWSVPMGIEISF